MAILGVGQTIHYRKAWNLWEIGRGQVVAIVD